jgi:hypothetical protein
LGVGPIPRPTSVPASFEQEWRTAPRRTCRRLMAGPGHASGEGAEAMTTTRPRPRAASRTCAWRRPPTPRRGRAAAGRPVGLRGRGVGGHPAGDDDGVEGATGGESVEQVTTSGGAGAMERSAAGGPDLDVRDRAGALGEELAVQPRSSATLRRAGDNAVACGSPMSAMVRSAPWAGPTQARTF